MFSRFSSPAVAAFALVLLGAGAAQAQSAPGIDVISDSLTLDGTVRSVLDANPAITTLDELANAATGRLAQTRTGFLPQVTGTASYTRIDPVVQIPLGCAQQQLRGPHHGAVPAARFWQEQRDREAGRSAGANGEGQRDRDPP